MCFQHGPWWVRGFKYDYWSLFLRPWYESVGPHLAQLVPMGLPLSGYRVNLLPVLGLILVMS